MSQGRRINVEEARAYAIMLMALLRPVSVAQRLCGSVRRGRTTVGDIELVVIPELGEPSPTLFGGGRRPNLLWRRVDQLVRLPGPLGRAPATRLQDGSTRQAPWGERYRKLQWHNIQVDLFSTTRESWGAMLLIRTGPPEVSQRWVTALKARGLRMHEGQVVDEAGHQVPVTTEQAAFELAGWPFVPPEHRDGWARHHFRDDWLRRQLAAQPALRSR